MVVKPPPLDFRLGVSWERAPGVVSAELAATWCTLQIDVGGSPITLVEDQRGQSLRRSVHTSAYPLAEWIATRWWSLRTHLRPTATSAAGWTWDRVGVAPWLHHHNLRAAGNGMPWPDLTIVPEGGVTRLRWNGVPGVAGQPIRFLTSGDTYLSTESVTRALSGFILQVLDRLDEAGVHGTPLQQEWSALAELDRDQQRFAAAAARLGLDPFNLDDGQVLRIERLGATLEGELLDEFLDSADPNRLDEAGDWLRRARARIVTGEQRRSRLPAAEGHSADARPWEVGYTLGRRCREHLGLAATDRVELRPLVGLARVGGDAAGLQGVMAVVDDAVGVALPSGPTGASALRFAQARALGLSLLTQRDTVLLDPTSTELAMTSRAFAAELLAPAAGISEYLRVLPAATDRALDAIAGRFGTSALLVQRQYENQML